MQAASGNLWENLPPRADDEVFEELLRADNARVERIISTGQSTPPGEWLDQAWHEWVVLLHGAAAVRIEGETEPRRLAPGDWLALPAHCRHRVEWTDPEQSTVWLAVHLGANEAE